MFAHQAFVLHSPYPDHSWRGIEKCVQTDAAYAALVFFVREDAENFLQDHSLEGMVVVEVTLVTPVVRGTLDSATASEVDRFLPEPL